MIELVLTKDDLTHLTAIDGTTVLDSGVDPKKAYTLINPDMLDAPGVCRVLAAIGVLDTYEDDYVLSYVSYVEDGALYPISDKQGITVAELKRSLEGIIKETTKPLDVLSIRLNKEDCERIQLYSGKPMWKKSESVRDLSGFTITLLSGQKYEVEIPEYLRMSMISSTLSVTGLAAAVLALEKLSELPKNAVVDSVHFDLPGTERDKVSLLPEWLYVGVYHPVRVSELFGFLSIYVSMLAPGVFPSRASNTPNESERR